MRFLVAIILHLALPPAASATGALVIAGGAIADDHGAIYRAILERRPPGRKRVIVVPLASAEPVASGARAAALFVRHGAEAGDVEVVRLAAVDDPGTPEDEAGWARNADSPAETARIEGAGAIWFTGGDQARITSVLLRPDGTDTAMLAAMRRAHRSGAVVGGTSAGAAAMSDPMILAGDPVAAAGGSGETLIVGRGLGFLARGITDQHFDARYRLPRLLKALALRREGDAIGYGVAEDTALVVEGDRLLAVGRGLVTVVDARLATPTDGQGFGAEGLAIRFLADGQAMPRP
jgi:cyanophycinase